MHNDGSHAPEVVPGSGADGLIPAPDRAVEAPQSLHENTSPAYSYPPGYKDDQAYSSAYGTQDEKLANVTAAESGLAQARPNKRKRLIWIVIGAILLALAIGLGVGLGVGLSQNSNDEDQNAETGENQEATQTDLPTTTITPTSATTTPTSSAVTSGSTGLAQFSCNSTETTTSESGTPYIQECYTQYQVNRPSFYNPSNTTLSNLGGKLTVYTFQDCLDKCDERNEAGTNPPCRAVTYYANLTKPIQLWGGNCFLKNDRGNGFQTDPVDWGHTASAYMSCLNETCWGENV